MYQAKWAREERGGPGTEAEEEERSEDSTQVQHKNSKDSRRSQLGKKRQRKRSTHVSRKQANPHDQEETSKGERTAGEQAMHTRCRPVVCPWHSAGVLVVLPSSVPSVTPVPSSNDVKSQEQRTGEPIEQPRNEQREAKAKKEKKRTGRQ